MEEIRQELARLRQAQEAGTTETALRDMRLLLMRPAALFAKYKADDSRSLKRFVKESIAYRPLILLYNNILPIHACMNTEKKKYFIVRVKI